MFRDIRNLDFYRKIPRDLTEGTLSGASLSVAGGTVLFLLFLLEFNSYLSVNTNTQIVMDTSADSMLQINFNVSVPHIPCRFASVDVMDIMKTKRINVTRNIQKWRIDAESNELLGQVAVDVPAPKYETYEHGHADHKEGEQISEELTGSTFDAFVKEHKIALVNFYAPWCIWCKRLHPVWEHTAGLVEASYSREVRFAKIDCTAAANAQTCHNNHVNAFPTVILYRNGKGHSHEHYHGDRTSEALMAFIKGVRDQENMADEEAAKAEAAKAAAAQAAAADKPSDGARAGPVRAEGCRISGAVAVKKVPGNLLITVHSDGHTFDNSRLNIGHTFHELSFGPTLRPEVRSALPKATLDSMYRLHDRTFKSHETNTSHEHYVKVVGHQYSFLSGQTLDTYTYSVNSHEYVDDTQRAALKLSYDLSPMSVVVTEERMPFYHFVTSVCAIIGGVFTVIGLIDSIVYHGVDVLQKKMKIGKHL